MIAFISDSIEPWLAYIWEQFAQINILKSEYKFFTYEAYTQTSNSGNYSLIIEYSFQQRFSESLFIPKRNVFRTDDYVWIRNDLPVYSDTLEEKGGEFDILFNAFVHLSRLEEWHAEGTGKPIRSYAFNHPRKDKRVWKIPIVNHLFNELEEKIKSKRPGISFGEKEKPLIEFSHDVDYLRKTIQLRIKQSAIHFHDSARHFFRLEAGKSLTRFLKGIEFAFKSSDYWCFDYWTELEKKLNINSVYYIYARVASGKRFSPRKWLLDPSYDIREDKRLIRKCRELLSMGHKIGLHGSFLSAEDETLFLKEKNTLEKTVNCRINKNRQHWLNYTNVITPYIHDKSGIEVDSSLGFNDISGFRSGIASTFNPYDHRNQSPFSFCELPLVIMDAQIHDYSEKADPDCFGWLSKCTEVVKKFAVSVDWHQRVISSDYHWIESYKELAKKLRR